MAKVEEYRSWLSSNFGICKYPTGSPDDLTERAALACKLFYDTRNLKALIESLVKIAPTTTSSALETVLNDATKGTYPFDLNGKRLAGEADYVKLKLQLEDVYKRAMKLSEFSEKYSQACAKAKEARIFAKNTIAAFQDDSDSSSPILVGAKGIISSIESAEASKAKADYFTAFAELEKAEKIFESLQGEIKTAANVGKQEAERSKDAEEKAFRLFGGSTENMRDMVGNPDVMNLMIGVKFDSESGMVKSEALKEMELVFAEAIKRYDKLKKSGLDPIKAADIALANIPRAFWPNKAIREIAMFERVEDAIALEEAQKESLSLEDAISRGEGFQDPLALGTSFSADTIERALKMQLGLKDNAKLPEVGNEKDAAWRNLNPDQKSLLKIQSDLGNAGKGVAAFGVFLKGVTAFQKTKDFATTEFEGPVQKKIAEFEAKAALFDLAKSAKDMGADLLKDVCPAIGVVTSALDMLESIYLAAKYFKRLHDIQRLGEKAKRDPESVMYLPLIRMDKNERLKAAEQVVRFVETALATAGKSAQLSGVGAAAGLGIDAAGKIVAQGSKVVFKGIRWSDAKKAKKALAKARAKPIDRKAVQRVFKYSNKYATYVIAISAVEDSDTWALRYCMTSGLTESEVSDSATSIDVLRKYIVMEAKVDDEQKTFGEELADSIVAKPFVFIANKVKKSREVTCEPSEILDEETNVYVPNPKFKGITAPVGLSRKEWQVAKQEATQLGWYDDKSGMGDFLTELEQARTEWQSTSNGVDYLKSPTPQIVSSADRYWGAMRSLQTHLASIRPMAKDRVTTFEPMQKYMSAMQKLLSDEIFEFSAQRSVFLEVYFNTVTDGVKQLQIEKQERAKENTKRVEDVRNTIVKLAAETKWDSPFGPTRLADFERLTCEKLGLVESIINKRIDSAVKELESSLIAIALDELGGYLPNDLPKAYAVLQKNELASIAYDTLEEFASQARDIRNETLGGVSSKSPLNAVVGVGASYWLAAVDESKANGLASWKGSSSSIEDALTRYEEEYGRYLDSGIGHYIENAQDALRQALEKIEKTSPLDGDGITFEPMSTYMYSLSEEIDVRIEELDEEIEEEFQYTLPTGFDLDSTSWAIAKQDLVSKLMKDTSTGIGKALQKFALAKQAKEDAVKNKAEQKVVDQTIIDLVNALDKLMASLNDFTPMTKSKKTHVGGLQVRNKMIELVNKEYEKAKLLQKPLIKVESPKTVDQVTFEKWETAKKEFIRFGLVDEKTGIGKAIKAFQKAKPGKSKDEARANLQMAIDQAKPLDRAGRVFEPARQYLLDTMKVIAAK